MNLTGDAHHLIVDTTAMRARYLDIEIDKDLIGSEDDRHSSISISSAQLVHLNDRVMLDGITSAQIAD